MVGTQAEAPREVRVTGQVSNEKEKEIATVHDRQKREGNNRNPTASSSTYAGCSTACRRCHAGVVRTYYRF